MKKLWSIRNLLLAVATLGCLTASAAAEAKTVIYYNDYPPPAPVRIYEPAPVQQMVYPSSCYYVHEDSLGHHTWRVRPECSQPVVYGRPTVYERPTVYAPVIEPRHVWHDDGRSDNRWDHDDHHDWDDHHHD